MKIKSIRYSQYDGTPEEWRLEEFSFEDINLIVGKNATGKTKTLNIISGLANTISLIKTLPYSEGNYQVTFDKDGEEIIYILRYTNRKIINEQLIVDNRVLLTRTTDGTGEILTDQVNQKLKFQVPDNEVAVMAKRDKLLHPFLEDLFIWGSNLMIFRFGSSLGQDHFAIFSKEEEKREQELIIRDTNRVAGVYKIGLEKFGNDYVESIKKDLHSIDYNIDDILILPVNVLQKDSIPTEAMSLSVKENDLECITAQTNMSQGMFRALSLIIQINYYQMAKMPNCILIDDIGEGLDYDRSINLINLIVEKAKNSHVQLIMATNDRFVMNNVPLQFWSIIQRERNKSVMINYKNSPKIFDAFAATGLSNFDFFSSKYYLGNPNN